jgi:apolipoprotein N-acyltransferase
MTSLTRILGTLQEPSGKFGRAWPYGLAVWSGLAVFASFEPIRAGGMIFVALIPWMIALRARPESARLLSYVAGLTCWIPSVWFLRPVTIMGVFALGAYCAVYWVPAGWLWAKGLKAWNPKDSITGLRLVVGGSGVWVLLELLRGWLFTGFPWNNLGVAQVDNPALIQLAALGGVPLISFLIVAMNFGLGLTALRLGRRLTHREPWRVQVELYLPLFVLALAFRWGMGELRRQQAVPVETLRIAVVQPNIDVKWEPGYATEIRRILWELSELAIAMNPDLLLWPETALPDELRFSAESSGLVRALAQKGVPILLGTLDMLAEHRPDAEPEVNYFNAAMLIDTEGRLLDLYWKRHLVMFGEYIPFGNLFPFLRSMTPMPEDVTPGEVPGVMELPTGETVGILICFEDLMPYLSRDLVNEGVELFVNLTNDGWFDPFWGSRAHLDHAVFRSVEFRRPTVRATNTGVSAWIDLRGQVRERLEDAETGEVRVRGFKVFNVEVPQELEMTFFARRPQVMVLGALLAAAFLPGLFVWRRSE